MEPEYLAALNPEQRAAVMHGGPPLLILAGAGSGKTRVITTKIAYLIQERDVRPETILAVTFTKKAAAEMQERAVALEPRAERSQLRTFHSFGACFLRRYAEFADLVPSFTVYDDDDVKALLSAAVPALSKKEAAEYARHIALAKDYCLSPDDDLTEIDASGALNEIYEKSQRRLLATGNADFGDLIMRPAAVMERDERIRRQMHRRFRVIMVDEYQDSNVAQFRLLRTLSGVDEESSTYVCVVGDDDQSIYKFRGAEIQNILRFPEQFPGTQIIRLERNYRSTGRILAAADAVVRNNSDRLGKTLVAERGDGAAPALAFLPTQADEAEFCARLIEKSVSNAERPARYSDWAILYRTNAQSRSFETEFLHRKIPYVIVGSLRFYEREEVKDALACLALVANGRNEVAFRRIANKPARGIGKSSLEKIIAAADGGDGTEAEAAADLIDAAERRAKTLPSKAAAGTREFCGIIRTLRGILAGTPDPADEEVEADGGAEAGGGGTFESDGRKLSEFVQVMLEKSGLLEYHQEQDKVEGTARTENIQELANSAVFYPLSMDGLLAFLDAVELDQTLAERNGGEAADAVTLITLHNTKGLEFPRVVITGLENGVFPREDKVGSELEEERRLFYVGITRAKDELYITSCADRVLFGRYAHMLPSRFLREAGDVFRVIGKPPAAWTGSANSGGDGGSENSGKADVMARWRAGTIVFHDDFGYGSVASCKNVDGEVVVEVRFETGTAKKFMPEYQAKSLLIIKD